ncbi:type II toxin-antitoxin system PemK/MazF family toxin [Rhodococcus pyridinivorans]|uniref:type II toxin-antitoxin system PemK/MazF family toxin n=1 Tax=Rhodococcus pyridinivorans TaxID=103816 RepID=UPI0002ECD245|nr:type II toxin-antitoxin system PemK/MazF family toxin [Rhodococcus pyridinivorans]MCD2139354.1 type II toxin-antitoxin system PemK/MazF family toxin [Rhodococcus pyridinivorans]
MAGTWKKLGRQLGRLAVDQGPKIYQQLQQSGALDKARAALNAAGRTGAASGTSGSGTTAAPKPGASGTTAPKPGAAKTQSGTKHPAPGRPVASRTTPTAQRARRLEYSPDLDGRADPGEIVWTWVAYEEDPTEGKDRPVLVVGRDDRTLLGLMLSSNSDRDGHRDWLGIGSGPWDAENRPSWVRLDRVLDVPEDGIRREGAILPRARFDQVATRLRTDFGWS